MIQNTTTETKRQRYSASSMGSGGRPTLKIVPTVAFEGFVNIICPNDMSLHTVPASTKEYLCPIDNVLLVWD